MTKSPSKAVEQLLDMGFDLDQIMDLISRGWEIVPTSCSCGGRWAWMRLGSTGYGELIMWGCICHSTQEAVDEFLTK